MKPLYMPLATLAQIARVDVDQVRRVIESEGLNLTRKFNENELDRVDSGLILNAFKKDGLNYAWWEVMERCQREDMMFEGAKCDPKETPEYAAWQAALHEYLPRPTDAKGALETELKWAYLHCPQYVYHVHLKKPPLPRKRRTSAAIQAMKAVDEARIRVVKPIKEHKRPEDMTEAQIKRAEINRRYYERKKNGGS